jgi:hypothetical protein
MTSNKNIGANQRNSAPLTSAGTKTGKEHSRLNATKHGIFARELLVSDEDKPEFAALRSALRNQLQPASALQQIGFDRIVCSCWRCKLATRLEMKRLKAHFELKEDQALQEARNNSPTHNVLARWYGATNEDLRKAIQLLVELGLEVATMGWLYKEKWRDQLINTFGAECFELFTKWDPMSIDAILMFEHHVAHAEYFDLPVPPEPDSDSRKKRLIVDPKLSWQMSVKLIDLTRHHLEDLARINRLDADVPDARHGAAALDLGARYVTTATRDLERAVAWYQSLKEQRL